MAIGTNASVEFFSTITDLDSASASVANAAFSVAGDLVAWTNSDDVSWINLVGLFTFSVAPDVGSTIEVYGRLLNIADTTKDADIPNANIRREYLGSFPLDAVTSEQVIPLAKAPLPNMKSGQEYEFYIENGSGQTLSAGWSLQETDGAYGPKV